MIIDAAGFRFAGNADDVGRLVAAGSFFWLDIFQANASVHTAKPDLRVLTSPGR